LRHEKDEFSKTALLGLSSSSKGTILIEHFFQKNIFCRSKIVSKVAEITNVNIDLVKKSKKAPNF
jgi:hypothetical protein